MNHDQGRLQHLLAKLEARYGPDDPDVAGLRAELRQLDSLGLGDESLLRYVGSPPFADRATRLAAVSAPRPT